MTKKSVKSAIHCEYFEVAPLLIFKAVLTNTAVLGIHYINPDHIFASEFANISLSLLKLFLLILDQTLPDIIVSNIVIMAIITDILIISKFSLLFPKISIELFT
jgi:hypothetical protein